MFHKIIDIINFDGKSNSLVSVLTESLVPDIEVLESAEAALKCLQYDVKSLRLFGLLNAFLSVPDAHLIVRGFYCFYQPLLPKGIRQYRIRPEYQNLELI